MTIESVSLFTDKGDKANTETGTETISGDGGSTLELWSDDRDTKIQTLNAFAGTTTNKSSFSLPSAILSTSVFEIDPNNDGEKFLGVTASGSLTSSVGSAKGVFEILDGDTTIAQEQASTGSFAVSAGPSDPVIKGGVTGSPQGLSFNFVPNNGVPFTKDNLSVGNNNVTISYFGIDGEVRDFNGNAISDTLVKWQSGEYDGSAFTDSNGSYVILGPAGTGVNLTSLNDSATKTETISQDGSNTVNFTYSGLEISIEIPTGTPVINGVVEFGEKVKRTGENGKVSFFEVPVLSNISLTLLESIDKEIMSGDEGVLISETETLGFGIKGVVLSDDKEPIRDITIEVDDGSGVKTKTGREGRFVTGGSNTDSPNLIIAREERRYSETTVPITVADGGIVERNIVLENRLNTGTE